MTLNTHVQRAFASLAIAGSMFGAAWMGMAASHADDQGMIDPFAQSTFPCQEDEVLGYAPQFGPDRVGCIHIEDLVDEYLPD